MSRPTDCIFCGKQTGSREHTFLAGLGGRRWNKGILCGECNKGFSDLDGLLVGQLEVMNGLLGVRSDHHKVAKHAVVTVPNSGESIGLDGEGRPHLAQPHVAKDEVEDDERRMRVNFANERQLQEWIADMRAQGLQPKVVSRGEESRLFAEGVPVGWSFGGSEAFREIGRIALNFLAHFRPTIARRDELKPFKDFVLGTVESRHVGYSFVDWEEFDLAPIAFPFGHRIILTLDEASGMLSARISFFSAFDLAVHFGSFDPGETTTIVVDIDPLAEHPPNDIAVSEIEGQAHGLLTEAPPELSSAQEIRDRLEELLKRIEDKHWEDTANELIPSVLATQGVDAAERPKKIVSILAAHDQRLLNLLRHAAPLVEERFGKIPLGSLLVPEVQQCAAPDEKTPDGITPQTREALDDLKMRIAEILSSDLEQGVDISSDRLGLLLRGGEGVNAAGKSIGKVVMHKFVNPCKH